MIKRSGRTPLYPRVQRWGDNHFIFPVRPLTIPTLRSGERAGGRRQYSRCCELLSFYRLDVSSLSPSLSFCGPSSARVCALLCVANFCLSPVLRNGVLHGLKRPCSDMHRPFSIVALWC